jgi:hypothetical protein
MLLVALRESQVVDTFKQGALLQGSAKRSS